MKNRFFIILCILSVVFACSKDTTYTIRIEFNSELGTVSPNGNVSVNEGDNKTFTITPKDGSYVKSMVIDTLKVEPIDSYTFNNVSSDHSLKVVFGASNSVLLTQNDWVLAAWSFYIEDGGVSQTIDAYNFPEKLGIPACIIDDVMRFDTDGSYTNMPGSIICDDNSGLLGNGEWSFNIGETVLNFKGYGLTYTDSYDIKALKEDELVISRIESLGTQKSFKTANLGLIGSIDAVMTMSFVPVE